MSNAIILEPMAATFTASASAAPSVPANLGVVEYLGVTWASGNTTSARITIDLGTDVAVDTVMAFGAVGASAAWKMTVRLASAAQGPGGVDAWADIERDFLAGREMPVSGLGKMIWRAPDGAPATARYVLIDLSAASAQNFQIGAVIVGQAIQLDRNFKFGSAHGVRPLGNVDFSRSGVPLPVRGAKLRGVGLTFGHIYRDEVERQVHPLLERVGNDTPIAICIDPDADDERQGRMYLGYLTGNLGSIWARPGGFQAEFNLIAIDR